MHAIGEKGVQVFASYSGHPPEPLRSGREKETPRKPLALSVIPCSGRVWSRGKLILLKGDTQEQVFCRHNSNGEKREEGKLNYRRVGCLPVSLLSLGESS